MDKAGFRLWIWTGMTAVAFGATGWLLGHSGAGAGAPALARTPAAQAAPVAQAAVVASPVPAAPVTALAPMDADHGVEADRFQAQMQSQGGDVATLARQEREPPPQFDVVMH